MIQVKWGAALAMALLAGACASEVVRHPTELAATAAQPRRFLVRQNTPIQLDTGYARVIVEGSELVEAGTIAQGRVLKPTNTTLTIEGAHTHEAYPVVEGERIVGFYLPVERAFSPLSRPVNLQLQERR